MASHPHLMLRWSWRDLRRRWGMVLVTAVIIAIGVNTDGRREVLGLEIGTSEAEPIWTEFLRRDLVARRLPLIHIAGPAT